MSQPWINLAQVAPFGLQKMLPPCSSPHEARPAVWGIILVHILTYSGGNDMKRLVALALGVAILVGISGCGGGTPTQEGTPPTKEQMEQMRNRSR